MLLLLTLKLLLLFYSKVEMLRSIGIKSAIRLKSKVKVTSRLMCNTILNPMATIVNDDYEYHVPVMKEECCKYLNIVPGGVYVDCTMGGGGHTKAILQRGGKVIGIDQDPDAIMRSQGILQHYINNGDCEIIQTNFRNIKSAIENSDLAGLKTVKKGKVDGVLMDLGVSSFQINEASRGFAFGQDGPLDMRMNKGDFSSNSNIDNQKVMYNNIKVISAHEIVNTWDGTALADVLYHYGDEVRSRALAREIIAARPLNSTGDLEKVISSKTSFKNRAKTLARCFQALRIVVNDEIGALEDALLNMHQCIRFGGTFVVMSYHSLEDRRVKQLFRTGSIQCSSTDIIPQGDVNPWKCSFKRAVVASEAEVAVNRRARSAKLRVAIQSIDETKTETERETETEESGVRSRRRMRNRALGLKERARRIQKTSTEESTD